MSSGWKNGGRSTAEAGTNGSRIRAAAGVLRQETSDDARLTAIKLSVEGLMAVRTEARADGGASNFGRHDTF